MALVATALVLALGMLNTIVNTPTSLADDPLQRTGTRGSGVPFQSHLTVDQIASALLNTQGASCLVGSLSVVKGADEQFEVLTTSGAGFPTDGSSYLLMSRGDATIVVPGTAAGSFVSISQGFPEGVIPVVAGGSPTGHFTNDRATARVTLFVPSDATTLSVDWKLGSEEPPTYYVSGFQDYFTAILNSTTVVASTWVDHNIDVLGANLPGGSSTNPLPPFPVPDNTEYNSMTPSIQTSSANVAAFAGGAITVDLHVADASDTILDSGAFLDNLGFDAKCDLEIDIKPGGDPNPINLKSNGVIPVAILGDAAFDVTSLLDVTTLAFGPAGASPAHDLTDPTVYADHLQDVNGDGYMDLVSHYRAQEIGIAVGDTEACLTAKISGLALFLSGCDSVKVK
jgi:hypothetical protein